MLLKGFLVKWEKKLTLSLGFLVVTHLLQIPHFLWGGDALMTSGMIYNVNPVLDFVLYGIDLIEIPAIIVVVVSFVSRLKNNEKGQRD
jgi:hypothetical protein